MLTFFTVERHFNKLHVSMTVEPTKRAASLTVTYDRRIVRLHDLAPYELGRELSPTWAEDFLGRQVGERGSFVEDLEWRCRSGLLAA